MKKLFTLALAVIMMFALAVPAMAVDADTATVDGVGFHCNHGGSGSGKTDVYYSENGPKDPSEILDAKGKVLKGVAADTGTKFKFDFTRVDETTWKLDSENYYCVTCGNNVWASYSNKSGVPNGKNIQVNPYTAPEEEPIVEYGSLTIQKTVGGVDFDVWAADQGLSDEEVSAILGGMDFTAYLLTGENGARAVPEKAFPGVIGLNGLIDFGNTLPVGWYEVVEEVSGAAVNYFAGVGGTKVVYVGETGVSGELENFVSGREGIGTVVSHDGTGVNWKLPNVWNERLAGQPAFDKLMAMGAQWIWDVADTYIYGVSGSAITLEFEVTLGEAINVPMYFAADNVALIYVNGKLAAYTDVALAGRSINIGDDYIGIDALGDKVNENFDGRWNEGWAHTYEKEVSLNAGTNKIIIIAANSASTGYINEEGNFVQGNTGTDNDSYNYQNNPCGLIFGFGIPAVTFDNEPTYNPYGSLAVDVDFEISQDTVTFEPVYKYLTEENTTNTLVSKYNHDSIPNSGQASIKVDLDRAIEGYDVEVADSSPENRLVGYAYNVKIVGNELVVTFGADLVKADVGIAVGTSADFNKNGHPDNKAVLGEVTNAYSLSEALPEGDDVYLFLHIAGGIEWYTGEKELTGWNEVGRENNPVEAEVTELTVELWLGEELIDSQDIADTLLFGTSFSDLEDGEYTIVVKGVVNAVAFEETKTAIVDGNSNESIDFLIQVKLADIEIK